MSERSLIAVAVLVSLSAVACSAQGASEHHESVKITVRVLNGKSGKPIRNEYPNIWVGEPKGPSNPKTDSNGDISLNVDVSRDRYLRVRPNYYADCRVKGDDHYGVLEPKYSLEEILTHGIVTQNVCGKSHVAPVPGVLVLYARPRTFLEKWRL